MQSRKLKNGALVLISVAFATIYLSNVATSDVESEAPPEPDTEIEDPYEHHRIRDQKFREKYCGKAYTPWKKMQKADNNTLANICWSFFTYKDRADEGAAEAERMLEYSALYGSSSDKKECEVVLDIMHCRTRYKEYESQIVGEAAFYLTEGSDPDTAYKFCMLSAPENRTRIITAQVFQNIWNLTVSPNVKLGSISVMDPPSKSSSF